MIGLKIKYFRTEGSSLSTTPPPPTEGPFDFVVATAAYSDPAGEGPFDFKVET
jgi:hypothetical protein